jgi:transposase
MIISSPIVIILSAEEHQELTLRAQAARTAHREVIRAKIILAAADGRSNAAIAAHLQLHVDTVRKWRGRYHHERLSGLNDRPRSGRPPRFTAVQVAEVKALACEPPATREVPLARWSCPDLAAEAASRGVVDSVSASTVRRWLAEDAINPGSTGPGSSPATPTSPSRPAGCWTCTPAAGTANRSAPTTT